MSRPQDPPRRLADLMHGFADVLAQWWLGFDVTEAIDPPDPTVPDDASELTGP